MKSLKLNRAFSIAEKCGVHNGQETHKHIMRNISHANKDILDSMTSKQLAQLIIVADKSYKDGKASTGAEMVDSKGVWIASKGRIFDIA